MIEKHYYQENLSEGQKEVIEAFNGLETGEEQERIVDILYDAVFERNLKAALSQSILTGKSREVEELQNKVKELTHQVNHWRTKTREALNNGITSKAERKAERREIMKEILEAETTIGYNETIKKQNAYIYELLERIKALKAELRQISTEP